MTRNKQQLLLGLFVVIVFGVAALFYMALLAGNYMGALGVGLLWPPVMVFWRFIRPRASDYQSSIWKSGVPTELKDDKSQGIQGARRWLIPVLVALMLFFGICYAAGMYVMSEGLPILSLLLVIVGTIGWLAHFFLSLLLPEEMQ